MVTLGNESLSAAEKDKQILYSEEITEEVIQYVTREIVKALNPEKMILYGSQARQNAQPCSDLDIMVVMETDEPPFTRGGIISDLLWGRGFAIDSYIITPEEFNYLKEVEDPFLMEVLSYGRTLYEQNA